MENVILELQEKGLHIADTNYAVSYLKYNTTWGMLKKSLYLSSKYKPDKRLDNFTFVEIKHLGLIEYHYKRANLILINAIEHQLKVSVSREYQDMTDIEEESYVCSVQEHIKSNLKSYDYIIKKSKYKNSTNFLNYVYSDQFKVYEVFDILYFRDLISLYELLPTNRKVTTIYRDINNIRNIVYHHDEVLRYKKARNTKHKNYKNIINTVFVGNLSFDDSGLTAQDENAFKNKMKNTLIIEQITLLNSTFELLSLDECTEQIRKHIMKDYFTEIELANRRVENTTSIKPWVKSLTKFIISRKDIYLAEEEF